MRTVYPEELQKNSKIYCNPFQTIKENDKYTKIRVGSEEESTEGMYIDENGIPLDKYVTIPEFLSTVYNGQNADGEYGLIESAKNLEPVTVGCACGSAFEPGNTS